MMTNDTSANKKDQGESIFGCLPQSRYEWRHHPLPARFLGTKDHAALLGDQHYIFFNPSISEVLCTSTAEALAMGKYVIIPQHPSNEFFYQFKPNCLTYRTLDECIKQLQWALTEAPPPEKLPNVDEFTWEAATQRLFHASTITKKETEDWFTDGKRETDERIAWLHLEAAEKGKWLKELLLSTMDKTTT